MTLRLITDPLRAPRLSAPTCAPGMEILHARGQWAATVVRIEGPHIWVYYSDDLARGIKREKRVQPEVFVRLSDVVRR
jgi:hypothetical protein